MKLREKYSIKPSNYNYSSFWLDNDWDTSFDTEDDNDLHTPLNESTVIS